jgi:crotonobetainyl-CoA:carnitine CoA-transferase CaiB-like acyl-CoA transferase
MLVIALSSDPPSHQEYPMHAAPALSRPTPPGILDGVRVVDLGRHRGCAAAALLLAELGADVVKLRLAQEEGEGLSAVQAAIWDRSKTVEEIDMATPSGRARLNHLLDLADVVLQDRTPAARLALALDENSVCAGRPALVFATIGSWPDAHPASSGPVDDILVMAQAGMMDEQEAVGRDGPTFIGFPLGSAHAAFLCATGVIVRLIGRHRTQRGGAVGTSLLQGALLPMMMYWAQAERPTASMAKGMPKQTPQTLYECQDGKWMHVMGDPARAPKVRALLEQMGAENIRLANDRFYGTRPVALPNIGALGQVFMQHPLAAWLEELWGAGVAVQPVTKTGALFEDEQAIASGYVASIETAAFGLTRQAATPFHVNPPVRVGPGAGAHGWSPRATPGEGAAAAKHPLAGIRVLDFGAYLAGPLATMLLADLGAEVIKVEVINGEPMRHVEWAFNGCQRGKRVIGIDLSKPGAAAVLERLVRTADVVHHNQRMPTARKLGIDYESLKKINPALVYAHVSAYGPQGPRKDWPGFDQLFQASAGWELEAAGEGNRPTWLRFGMMDHLAALSSLVATVGALYHREQTGEGQAVAASLLGASLFTLDTALDANGKVLPFDRVDARQMGFSATRRIYQCADGWLAVSSAGQGALARWLSASGAESGAALEQRMLSMDVDAGLALCDAAGIAAVRVAQANGVPFFRNADHRAAGLVASYPHPAYSNLEQIGALWNFSDASLALDRAPPVVGQHTRELMAEYGFTGAEFDALLADGVIQEAAA